MAEEINLILQDSGPDRLKRAEQRLKSVDWNKMAAHYRNMAFNPVNWSLGVSRVRLLQGRGHFSEALHGNHSVARHLAARLARPAAPAPGYPGGAQLSAPGLPGTGQRSLLGECLINAEREGVRSLFIEEGDGIRQLLQQLESTERQPALQTFIRGLLGIWPGQGVRKPQDALEEGLTEREREVVCLAAGPIQRRNRPAPVAGPENRQMASAQHLRKAQGAQSHPGDPASPRAEPALTMGHRDGVPASTIPLLQTKLFPPGAGGLPLLPRQALIDRLYEARGRRAMVLSAPAGFGKSTILCQLRLRLLEQGAAVAWLSCDETDGKPQRLIQYLLASIQRVVPAFGGNTANLLGTDVAVPLEGILDAFLADLRRLGRPCTCSSTISTASPRRLAAWGSLPDREPARSLRVVASTRFRPRFPGRRTDPQAWTFCLSAEDLRLSREESDAFLLDLKGLELGERELKLLFKRTEGWITALHLAALALSRNTDREGFLRGLSGTERNIADYLAEDVLASLPADLQLFLDQTSVLDEFNAELCNALTGRRDGLDMLMRLQNEQLFVIALDDQREWFRYHHLFAEFLQGGCPGMPIRPRCCMRRRAGVRGATWPTGRSSTPFAPATTCSPPSCWSARARA